MTLIDIIFILMFAPVIIFLWAAFIALTILIIKW